MNQVIIIAEAGVNHNGSMEIAKKLIDVATIAECDIVKFQTFKSKSLAIKNVQKAPYQKITTGKEESQLDMLKKLELPYEFHAELIAYANKKGIKFLSTPFDVESVEFLDSIGLEIFKIPSGEILDYPVLKAIGKTKKPVILSTGNSDLNEIQQTIDVLKKFGTTNITLMHCNSEYPTPLADVNLRAMKTMQDYFHLPVGYSDHTTGFETAVSAVALGATVYERHFTLDKNMIGPDHKASLEPDELIKLVKLIRNTEILLGNYEKKPSCSESKNKEVARKSIVAKCCIKKGEVFSEENLTTKRPSTGLSPTLWETALGKKADRDYQEDDFIVL